MRDLCLIDDRDVDYVRKVLIIFIVQLKINFGINLSIKDLKIRHFALNLINRMLLGLISSKEKALSQLGFCRIPSFKSKLATDCLLVYFSIITYELNITICVGVSS